MNPIDWSGPAFLVFYVALAAAVLEVVWRLRFGGENGRPAGALNLSDPYEIAYLRGGASEAGRVAVIGLIERRALKVEGKNEVVRADAAGQVSNPIELAVVRAFSVAMKPPKGVGQLGIKREVQRRYDDSLVERGLLPDAALQRARYQRMFIAMVLLASVAGAKILLALARGHTSVGLLATLGVVSVAAVAWQTSGYMRRTRAGDRAVADAKTLMDEMRVQPALGAAELMLMAAVFGVGCLPAYATPYASQLFPKAGDGGGGCGSSCGSSCGGGCGGGCGGCGGD